MQFFSAVGEECVFDMDCQFEAGHCENNICVDTAEGNQNVLSFIGELEGFVYITFIYSTSLNIIYVISPAEFLLQPSQLQLILKI
jgi:hypothetical protein